jgi:adenine deaminase
MIDLVLASRSTLYKLPGLEDVAENGGSRLNAQVMKMLKDWEKVTGLGDGTYAAAVVKSKK